MKKDRSGDENQGEEAILLLGHGSHLNPGSSQPVHAHAETLRSVQNGYDEVRTAFWKEEPSFRDSVRNVRAEKVYAVPVFMAEGYFVDQVIPRELDVESDRVTYTPPVGTHPSMSDVIEERALDILGDSTSPDDTALSIVGHGTERNPKSAESALAHVERIRRRGRFAEAGAVFMDEPPYVDDLTVHFDSENIVVVPFFTADGYHTREDIPEDIGIGEEYDVPATVDGTRLWCTGAVGTDKAVSGVIAERADEAPESDEARNDAPTPRRRAEEWFLRGFEEERNWGEVVVEEEERSYRVRHADDVDVPAEALESYEGRQDALDVAKYDKDGDYRPLRSEASLRDGWVFEGLDAREVFDVLDTLYPASVVNAYLSTCDDEELGVSNYAETAGRQTGIYADVDELRGDELSAATRAVCSSCVKKREWEEDDETEVDGPVNDGDFPCREACSFLIVGARDFLCADDEELTEADLSVRRGEFGDPLNRYTAKFLRERKRLREEVADA